MEGFEKFEKKRFQDAFPLLDVNLGDKDREIDGQPDSDT